MKQCSAFNERWKHCNEKGSFSLDHFGLQQIQIRQNDMNCTT